MQENNVLQNQQRNANKKIPLSGFMMKNKHASQNSHASKSSGHEE